MVNVTCPECRGKGRNVEATCPDCRGTGYDPNDENAYAQCHTCHGDKKIEVDECPKCGGSGQIAIEYNQAGSNAVTEGGLSGCSSCGSAATHVLVDYHHRVLGGGTLFCSRHAFDGGREQCHLCGDYGIEHDDVEYLPTYPAGALDGAGCCSDHP